MEEKIYGQGISKEELEKLTERQERERALMIDDTGFGMLWTNYKALMKKKGFKEAYFKEYEKEGNTEETVIHYNLKKGLIAWATSTDNKSMVTSAYLYFQIHVTGGRNREQYIYDSYANYSLIDKENLIYLMKCYIRDPFFTVLDDIKYAGKRLKTWTNYNDSFRLGDIVDFDYGKYYSPQTEIEYTKKRILECPKDFQDMIGKYINK